MEKWGRHMQSKSNENSGPSYYNLNLHFSNFRLALQLQHGPNVADLPLILQFLPMAQIRPAYRNRYQIVASQAATVGRSDGSGLSE